MVSDIPEAHLSQLSAFVAARMGLRFPRERWRDLERGINAAARELNFQDGRTFIEWLLSSSISRSQIEILASHLTIGETYFFRHRKTFAALEEQVLPELIRSRRENGRYLRIWSAGCATGEEPYSIAILLTKMLPDLKDWNITILATDINVHFLKSAAEGAYRHWSFRDTPPGIKERFFEQTGDDRFIILSTIKRMVTFSYLNLAEDIYPALANNTNAMDIIFCRNVLMYFVPELARKVVQSFYRSLVEGGHIVTSPSETSQLLFSRLAAVRHPGALLFKKVAHPASDSSPFSCKPPEKPKAPAARDSGRLPGKEGIQSGHAAVSLPPARAGSGPREPRTAPAHAGARRAQPATHSPQQPAAREQDPFLEARALFEGGCYAEALQKAEGLLLQAPSDARVPALIARILANWGRLDEALKWCEKAIAAERLDARSYYLMATVLQELGRIEEAASTLKKTLYLDPSFVMAYVTLGTISRRCGRDAQAAKYFENALAILATRPADEVLTESEGMNAGRLIEIIRSMQRA